MMDPVHTPTAGRTPDWIGADQATVTEPTTPRWLWPTVTALAFVIALVLGGGIGAAAGSGRTEVPQACLDAIAAAEEGFGYTADALDGSDRAIGAVLAYDAVELAAATDDLSAATDNLDALHPRWDTARTDCRAAAE